MKLMLDKDQRFIPKDQSITAFAEDMSEDYRVWIDRIFEIEDEQEANSEFDQLIESIRNTIIDTYVQGLKDI